MTNKPNTRPWDDTEEDDEATLAQLYGKYPRMQEDMALYVSIMNRGASFSIALVKVLHGLCLGFIQLHIRTPRWVRSVLFYGSAGFVGAGAGFAIVVLFVWLLTR
jgi:hypothetical protein